MKNLIHLGILVLSSASLMGADAKEELKAAIQKLAEKKNYSWSSNTQPGGNAAANTQRRGGPVTGKTEGDLTVITLSFGSSQLEIASKGDKYAYKGQSGWASTEESSQDSQTPQRGAFFGQMVRNYKKPTADAEELLSRLKDVKKDGDGFFGEMTEEGIQKSVSLGVRRPNAALPEVSGGKGTARFWVKDGVLTKYEYHVEGKVSARIRDQDREYEVNRTSTTEIKEIGTTKVELPEEARKKLS